MAPKRRLITDTFKVVKRAKKEQKEDKEPVEPEKEPEPEPRPMTQRQKDLLELQQFDLDWTYGPCSGISRMQRWERAELHGLKPPQAIRDLLLRSGGETEFTHCLWHDYPL